MTPTLGSQAFFGTVSILFFSKSVLSLSACFDNRLGSPGRRVDPPESAGIIPEKSTTMIRFLVLTMESKEGLEF